MDYHDIRVEERGEIAIVTLDRPASLNALSARLIGELGDFICKLHDRQEIRVVLLQGAGRAFCAGLDIKENVAPRPDESRFEQGWRNQSTLSRLLREMRRVPQPFIGLGHGSACGGGFSLLLACDVRFGAPDLRMNAAYIKIGLGGADIGSSYFLPRLVGSSLAAELLLTGRFIHAERALALGLLSDVVERENLLDRGLELAAEMLANSPYGLALTKQALNLNIDAPSIDAAFALEDRQQVMLTATHDHDEAMQAFIEKRPPVYRGR